MGVDACGECGTGCTWEKTGTALTIRGTGDDASIDRFNAENTPWGDSSDITSIKFEGTFQNIGLNSYFGGDNLSYITIPDSVTSISQNAFAYNPNLQTITIGDGVTQIGPEAFHIPANAKIYCHDTSKDRCAELIGANNHGNLSQLVLFEKDPKTGEIKVGSRKYASLEDLTNGNHIKKRKYTFEEAKEAVKAIGKKFFTFRLKFK